MRIEERKIAVCDLKVGMYVCRLECDWADTPYPLQGVLIASAADIDALSAYSRMVYIDTEQGLAPYSGGLAGLDAAAIKAGSKAATSPLTMTMGAAMTIAAAPAGKTRSKTTPDPGAIAGLPRRVVHRDTRPFDEELPQARQAQERLYALAGEVLDDMRDGRPIAVENVRRAVEPMVRSILRNLDAFLWIESLRKRGTYDYTHALNCSALAAAFGRHIGFPEEALTDLASGGLLLDVGKLQVPAELLARKGPLDAVEMARVRQHVELGLQMVGTRTALPLPVRDMIRTHHERVDGTGYPARLNAAQIPLVGRIAAVVDAYDAMTSERSYSKAISRHAALQVLYRERGMRYAAEIVEQFMQCLSVYPVGSLVELNTGEVAVVMAQNPARRLRPRVMLLSTPDKQPLTAFSELDLMKQAESDGFMPVQIAGTLQPGAYGLDPAELYL